MAWTVHSNSFIGLMYYKLFDDVGVGFALLADSEADVDREHQEQQETELDRLERWLTAAEAALSSLRCKPQHLTSFEEALTLHKVNFLTIVVILVTFWMRHS